jgi:hypothetical protein
VLARNAYNITGIITNTITPRMISPLAWGWGARCGLFWFGTCVLSWIWCLFRLPETKGRSYGELDILFNNRVEAWKFARTKVDRECHYSKTEETFFVSTTRHEKIGSMQYRAGIPKSLLGCQRTGRAEMSTRKAWSRSTST